MCSNPILTVERPMPDYTPVEGHWLRVFAFFGVRRLVAAFQSAVFRSPCSPCLCGESNGGQEFTTEAQRTRRNSNQDTTLPVQPVYEYDPTKYSQSP